MLSRAFADEKTLVKGTRTVSLGALFVAMLLVLAPAGAVAANNPAARQLIVGFDRGTARAQAAAIVRANDAEITQRLAAGTELVNVDPGASVAGVADDLASSDGVRYATPNFVVRASDLAADPLLSGGTMWGLLRLHAPDAWATSDGSGSVVAVLDGGVNMSNPDISPALWTNPREIPGNGIDDDNDGFVDDVNGADWIDRDGVPSDTGGHGTHVAGTIAAAAGNGFAGAGVAPGARIMPLRFLDRTGAGTVSDAIAAVDYAIAHGANVINASWGGPDYSPALRDAFARAGAAGIVVVTAAGNDGASDDRQPTYPAAFNLSNLIAVAASDQRDQLASFSNYGSRVAVAAPGVGIVSTEGAGIGTMSGTSMASPHVAGIAALLHAFKPSLSPAQTIAAVANGARRAPGLAGRVSSGGVADAVGALAAVGASVVAPNRGESPGAFKLKQPGKRVRIRGRRGWVRFSWSRAADSDLIGYNVIVRGKVRAHVRGTSVRLKLPAGRLTWSVVALDAQGNSTRATRSASSNGKIAVLRAKRH